MYIRQFDLCEITTFTWSISTLDSLVGRAVH